MLGPRLIELETLEVLEPRVGTCGGGDGVGVGEICGEDAAARFLEILEEVNKAAQLVELRVFAMNARNSMLRQNGGNHKKLTRTAQLTVVKISNCLKAQNQDRDLCSLCF